MAAKLELTNAERAARRAEQSRLCRAKKAAENVQTGSTAEPKVKKQPQAKTTALDVAQLLAAAGADLATFRPKGIVAAKGAAIDSDSDCVVLQINDVENVDVKNYSKQFKDWAADKDWRQHLRLAVSKLDDPKKKLPALQFYVVSDDAE